VLVQVDDHPALSTADRARLARWIAARLPERSVQIAYRPRQAAR
jgi:hypothetical protein